MSEPRAAVEMLRRSRPGMVVRWVARRALAEFAARVGHLSDLAGSRV